MNMVERRAVELAFPRSIFITFNCSELRSLFPEHLPIFYMYSLRRGTGVKPWFLPPEPAPCVVSSCKCRHSMRSDWPKPSAKSFVGKVGRAQIRSAEMQIAQVQIAQVQSACRGGHGACGRVR